MSDDRASVDDENVSERLPRSDAEADLLKPVIANLLRTIPDTWVEFDHDSLSAVQARALFLLTAAGMVERRGWMRTRIANHPTYFELHFQATGEGGLNRALEKASALQYQTWRDSWLAWKASETKDVSPFHSEGMKPNEWRLTDLGVDARCGLGSNNNSTAANCVFDFVLKCGLFGPGHWHLISTARALTTDELRTIAEHLAAGDDISRLRRPAVVGSGELLSIQKIEQPTSAQAVNLVNWAEGADAFTDAFAKLLGPTFERLAHALQSNSTDCDLTQDNLAPQVQASAPTGNAKPKPRLLVTNHPPQATLDGTAYAIKPDAAVFLIALLQANGDWVSPNTHGVRTNRVVKALPAEIRALIETAGAKGARIRFN